MQWDSLLQKHSNGISSLNAKGLPLSMRWDSFPQNTAIGLPPSMQWDKLPQCNGITPLMQKHNNGVSSLNAIGVPFLMQRDFRPQNTAIGLPPSVQWDNLPQRNGITSLNAIETTSLKTQQWDTLPQCSGIAPLNVLIFPPSKHSNRIASSYAMG